MPTGDETDDVLTSEELTREVLAGYFGKHCECRPLDIERSSHSHDCDDDPCEDVRVALGGRPDGCGYRGTVEAIIHTQAARRRICDDISAADAQALALSGRALLEDAARLNARRGG